MQSRSASHLQQLLDLYPVLRRDHQERLVFIVSGKHFIVQTQQLKAYPETLLGDELKRQLFYDSRTNTYRFDRHPAVFESVLYYYLNPGMLIRPAHIEPEIFYDELRFWQINEHLIEMFIDDDMVEDVYLPFTSTSDSAQVPLDELRILPAQAWRRAIWTTLTYPYSARSPFGQLATGLSVSLSVLSCIPFMSEIVPTVSELTRFKPILGVSQIHFPLYMRPSYIMEILCIVAFTVEFNLRVISAPLLFSVVGDVSSFLDFMSILSSATCLISYHLHNIGCIDNFLSFYYWLLIIKSFRIFRLARHLSHLRWLYQAIAISLHELCALIISVTFCVLLFGTLIYIIDSSEAESNTRNILDGFWLAFITLTTLGYGDVYPRSFEARLTAAFCALIGIVVFSMPTTIVFAKYTTLIHNRWKRRRSVRSSRGS